MCDCGDTKNQFYPIIVCGILSALFWGTWVIMLICSAIWYHSLIFLKILSYAIGEVFLYIFISCTYLIEKFNCPQFSILPNPRLFD